MMKRTAIVTGATSGIGNAILTAYSDAGYRVFPIGQDKLRLENTLGQIPESQLAGFARADLSQAKDVDSLVQSISNAVDSIDVLVLAAGLHENTELGKSGADHWDRLFMVNVRGVYMLIQGLVHLLSVKAGQILLVNSSVLNNTGQGVAVFKSTQHALQGMANSLRQDLNSNGIRVTSIYPGQVATPRMEKIYLDSGKIYLPDKLLQPADVGQLAVAISALPANVEVTDLSVRSSSPY